MFNKNSHFPRIDGECNVQHMYLQSYFIQAVTKRLNCCQAEKKLWLEKKCPNISLEYNYFIKIQV